MSTTRYITTTSTIDLDDRNEDLANTVINSDGICFSGDDPCDLIVNDQVLHFPGGVAQIMRLFAAQMQFDDLDDQRDTLLREMDMVDEDITDNFPSIVEGKDNEDNNSDNNNDYDPDSYSFADKMNDQADEADRSEDPVCITQKMIDNFWDHFYDLDRTLRLKKAKNHD